MTTALGIIQREHHAFAIVLRCLVDVLDEIRRGELAPDFDLFDAILSYVQDFPDRFHHPKEEEVLFPLIGKRVPELRMTLAELERQHHDAVRVTSSLKWKLDAWRMDPKGGFHDFDAAARQFVDWQRRHMALEEREVLAVALAKLSPDDWTAANAAFADNDDPMFGRSPRKTYDSLLSKIAALAPEPYGLAVRKP